MFVSKVNFHGLTKADKKDEKSKHSLGWVKYALPMKLAMIPVGAPPTAINPENDIFIKAPIETEYTPPAPDVKKYDQMILAGEMGLDLTPNYIRAVLRDRVITLDPGHGGNLPRGTHDSESGTLFKDPLTKVTYYEKDAVLSIAQKTRDYLEKFGANVVMTRDSDVFVELHDRSRIARENNSDVFIPIHIDNNDAKYLQGYTVYEYQPVVREKDGETKLRKINNPKDNDLLVRIMDESLAQTGEFGGIGIRFDDFKVLREADRTNIDDIGKLITVSTKKQKYNETKIPATAYLELGFFSNLTEARRLIMPEYQDQLAKSIAKGIITYFAAIAPPMNPDDFIELQRIEPKNPGKLLPDKQYDFWAEDKQNQNFRIRNDEIAYKTKLQQLAY